MAIVTSTDFGKRKLSKFIRNCDRRGEVTSELNHGKLNRKYARILHKIRLIYENLVDKKSQKITSAL